MPAVKPQSSTSLSGPIIQPGPPQPSGCTTVNRFAGSSSSSIGTRNTAWTSRGLTTATRLGVVPPAEHRGDGEVARRQPELRQHREDVDPVGVAARSPPRPRAARPRPRLVGVERAAGEGHLPRLRTHVWARSVSSRSGPSGPRRRAPAPRPHGASASSGGTNRLSSSARDRRAPSRTGSSHAGRPGSLGRREGRTRREATQPATSTPARSATRSRSSTKAICSSHQLDRAVGVDEDDAREAADPEVRGERAVGVGEQRVGHPRLGGQRDRPVRLGVEVVDAEHVDRVAASSWSRW